MKNIKFIPLLIIALGMGFTSCENDEPEVDKKDSITTEGIFNGISKDEMVFVKGGAFMMGATEEQGSEDPWHDENPVHEVALDDFYIGKYEVTQQLWEYVMSFKGVCADGSSISAYDSDVWFGNYPISEIGLGSFYPAYFISYNDIVDVFLPRLNRITGKSFRLPTEAEWEYAARGGVKSKGYKYAGSNTIGDVAWYYDNSFGIEPSDPEFGSHQVGFKVPNELGIYDMSGNVYEWCSDWYSYGYGSSVPQVNPIGPTSGTFRVLRGGGWIDTPRYCRVSTRLSHKPSDRQFFCGFRLVMDL